MLLLALAIAGRGWALQIVGIDVLGIPTAGRESVFWFHIMFGSLALVAGALNFRHRIRRSRPALHRRIGEAYVLSALVTGFAGGWLALGAFGGVANRFGFGGLAIATLVTTGMAYRAALAKRFTEHWGWMVRSYAMILAAVTLRLELPLLAIYFEAFRPAYAIVAWSCWLPNLLVAEWIVRSRDKAPI